MHFQKGHIPWNKGRKCDPLSTEHKMRISEANRGREFTAEHKQRLSQAAKGKPKSPAAIAKIRASLTGRKLSEEHKNNLKGRVGPRSPRWKGGRTNLNGQIRASYKYVVWRQRVFERDDFTCQSCKKRGIYLEAHHIVSVCEIIEKHGLHSYEDMLECSALWDADNGLTLCLACHRAADSRRH